MKLVLFCWIILCTVLNTAAQLLLKAGAERISTLHFSWTNFMPILGQILSSYSILLGLFCYGLSVVVWIGILSRLDVGVAYPLVSLGYVLNAIAAHYFFGEVLSSSRLIGIFFILLGVYWITKSI